MNIWLVSLLLSASGFSDPITCTLQGYIFHDNAKEAISWTAGNYCPLRVTTDETQMVIYSPHHWVVVKIPVDKGNRRFQYRFGSDTAHLEADTIFVISGKVDKG